MAALLDGLARQHEIEYNTGENHGWKDAQTQLFYFAYAIRGTETRYVHPEIYIRTKLSIFFVFPYREISPMPRITKIGRGH